LQGLDAERAVVHEDIAHGWLLRDRVDDRRALAKRILLPEPVRGIDGEGAACNTHNCLDHRKLEFLNAEKVRATYGAVAQVLGVIPRSLGALLGHRQAEASWIVSAATGLPTDYAQQEMHPDLLRKGEIIGTGNELMWRLAAWRARRSK
jgi:hypothetical protein